MRTHRKSLAHSALALALVLPFAACDQGPSPEVQARLDSLQTTRDSLARELAERSETIQQLTTSIERAASEVSETGVTAPENLQDRIETLASNLQSTRSQLEEAQRRIRVLSRQSSTLRDSLDAVITERDEALAMQRDSIDQLVTALDSMSSQAEMLSTERADLSEALAALEQKYYTVYVAVGTRDELIQQGVIEEEGGARVLLILWKAGETLVPARDLPDAAFEAMDFRQTTTIDLPQQGTYGLVSRHNPEYLATSLDENGAFTGASLEITEPEMFWQSSRYLILVRQE
jgi:prefoldin subunit 5